MMSTPTSECWRLDKAFLWLLLYWTKCETLNVIRVRLYKGPFKEPRGDAKILAHTICRICNY